MDEKITVVGIAVLAVGMLLLFGFMPMIGESSEKVSDDYEFGDFEHYSKGDYIIIYGTLTEMRVNNGNTVPILDGQDDIPISVDGNISGYVKEGQDIYVGCTVHESWACSMEYLTAQPSDIRHKSTLDIFFGIISISGLAVLAVSLVKKV